MSELNINDLPFEILVKVFQFLDVVNLKNASMICKLWNNIIESEFLWSLNLDYNNGKRRHNYPYSEEQKLNFILATNRKFGTIKITSRHFIDDSQIRRIFKRHGFNVVKLTISGSHIENHNRFAEFLKFTPNLKYAKIHNSFLTDAFDDKPLDCVLPDLKKLKNLVVRSNQYGVVRCFRKAKLTALTISENRSSEHCVPIVDFLLSQGTLKSLTFEFEGLKTLALMDKWNVSIPFRLTHLVLTCTNINCLSHDNNTSLLRFVKSQAESLTELEVGVGVPSSVYECVFTSMPRLNTLCISNCHIPMDNDFYSRLKENRSVRTIKLWVHSVLFQPDNYKFIGKFFKKLPNVRSLILPRSNKNAFKVASKNLHQLESLCIESLSSMERSIVAVRFPNLKTLHIQYLKVRMKWSKFAKNHPRLAELTVDKVHYGSFLTCGDIERIITHVDLQRLRLGVGFLADKRLLEIIRTKGISLKTSW